MSRERGLGGGAQTKAPHGHSLRPLRATVPGFSVSGDDLDRAAILNQHALGHLISSILRIPRILNLEEVL